MEQHQEPQQNQRTHYMRQISAGIFVALFSYFGFHLWLFAVEMQKQNSLTAFGIGFTLIVALYLALIPAAAVHGSLSAAGTSFMETIATFEENTPKTATTTESEEHSDNSTENKTLSSILSIILSPPAIFHAFSNVCTRAALRLAHTIITNIIASFPAVTKALNHAAKLASHFFQSFLHVVYPYIETAAIAIATWLPIAITTLTEFLTTLYTQIQRVGQYWGQLIHDSWDPVILPVIMKIKGAVVVTARHIQGWAAAGVRVVKNVGDVVYGVLEWLVAEVLVFQEWARVFLGPVIASVVKAAVDVYFLCLMRVLEVVAFGHRVLEIAYQVYVFCRVSEIVLAVYDASVFALKKLFRFCHTLITMMHSILEFIFVHLNRFAVFSRLFTVCKRIFSFTYPYFVHATLETYAAAQLLIAYTKLAAIPIINAINKIWRVCVFSAAEIYAIVLKIDWTAFVKLFVDWSLWEQIGSQLTQKLEDTAALGVKIYGSIVSRISNMLSTDSVESSDFVKKTESEFEAKENE
ncbi:hypothetical protein HK100_001286 [Physocladia obscura]|uniref:Uncharacterized protein n=1 Tax=Physocladia obscura TaxID=109957 RepID=A0AAD5T8J1_9FUNG|nr:hypothetical protein HK100_001286 [Physocladia obscura]